ncbi:YaiI/YqxD family protein [Massilia sp. PAMC28688]|uniref:YaiI/YqxD family protein n=1 Tax=Massilia sp. PAMC28688 TaxID=2861283 RepID=UPI001C625EEB|nr:YaiI/YqxD family protein [Massilia sp. PAMC28688]QYF95918.1 YaiI/YqxD family protein [Massilia sp. PAMC28688]
MQIYVDADACPAVIKEILYRVAERLQLNVTLVANQLMRVPASRFVRSVQVPSGPDVADAEIVRLLSPGDLVVTGDIPLASDVLEKGGYALNPRGEFYTNDNIAQMLTMRKFMDELRGSGVDTGGPAPFSQADRQSFANALDRHLARYAKLGEGLRRPLE